MKINLFKYFTALSLILFSIFIIGCSDDDENEINNNPANDQNVGVSANSFLSSDTYDNLIIEVQYARGYAPPTAAINNLQTFLEQYLNKPAGISVITNEINAPGQTQYSVSDIQAIEDNNRTQFTDGKTIAAYFFFADSGYSEDTNEAKVLGIAYRNTSMALFQKTIEDLSGGLGQPSTNLLTSTVMNHEFGHILGLVNNGTSMVSQHQDVDHGHHCNAKDCLMYWAAETGSGIAGLLGMSSPPGLDAQCISDLKANGGK
ncbi:peptidase [Fulvivirga sp. 29W222]|uniref:Peptidase n=1 Tax=Fulvivirga marina TaxID=2494733 RepID=A0A937G441_9BACT|nr:peptidase [Fulvivirga marina]MBL6449663.1 peptidase [Fulvivirga marina]